MKGVMAIRLGESHKSTKQINLNLLEGDFGSYENGKAAILFY